MSLDCVFCLCVLVCVLVCVCVYQCTFILLCMTEFVCTVLHKVGAHLKAIFFFLPVSLHMLLDGLHVCVRMCVRVCVRVCRL